MRLLSLLCIPALCAGLNGTADEAVFKKGPWELSVDKASGAWQSLKWNGESVCEGPASKEPFNWGPDWPASKDGSKPVLRSQSWNEGSGELTLSYACGKWSVDEILAFGAQGRPDRIGMSLRLTYSPETATKEPEKFKDVVINAMLPKKGSFLFPAKRGIPGNDGKGELAQLPEGAKRSAAWGIWPLLIEQAPGRSLLFMPDARKDIASLSFEVEGKAVCVRNQSKACGWAYPGEPQTIGPFYLEVFQGGLDAALKEGVWRFYDDIGLKVPSDTPDWVRDAVLYSFHPGGSTGSNWRDLGGFAAAREELLPELARTGFDAVWILPVEDASPYWPRDYYKFAPNLGTGEEYAALIDKAHGYGMKVWQDNVPHGGSPAFGEKRGNKPWQLVFDENGDALNYWCFDFGNPEWQKYIADVVESYIRKYKIDGYRIDACGGSKIPNWRKKDFPSLEKTPKNVPALWWQSELKAIGGKLPPMPYERASVTERQGGLEMLHVIREAVRRCSPVDGAILGEVQYAPYMQEADALYDFDFCGMVAQMRRPSFADFAAGLARWLEEQKCAEPRGTIRMRYVESHDSLRSRGFAGVDGAKAMTAISMFVHGIPMVYQDSDVGEGLFLKKLIALRKALPELRRGDASYSTALPGCVFSCVRSMDGLVSVALVNLSPDAVKAQATVPPQAKGPFSVWNCSTGKRLEDPKDGSFGVDLKPWEHTVIAFRPANAPCPVAAEEEPAKAVKAEAAAGKVSFEEREDAMEIAAPAYKLTLGKADGLPQLFAGKDGQSLIDGAGLLIDNPLLDKEPVKPSGAKLKASSTKDGARVEATASLPSGATMKLVYDCLPDRVRIEASLEGSDPSAQLGLAFASKGVERWQASTAEGLLDELYSVRHEKGIPSNKGNIYYRPQGTPMLWQAKTVPLDPLRPLLCAYKGGNGVELAVEGALDGGLGNALVMDKLGKSLSWHAAFLWRDAAPWEKPLEKRAEKFVISLRPSGVPLAPKDGYEAVKMGELSFGSQSSCWLVENKHYSVSLLRTGGVINRIKSKATGLDVLGENDLYSDRGFSKKEGKERLRAAAFNDGETSVRIWKDGEELHMLFTSMLRGDYRFDKLNPPVWASIEYVFDKSPGFQTRWSVLCEGQPKEDAAFLSWIASSPLWSRLALFKDGKEIASGAFNTGSRSAETATLPGAPLPDAVCVYGKDGEALLSLSKISHPAALPTQNIFAHGQNLFIAWLDKEPKGLQTGKWHETSMTVTAGKER